ncbi:hypothetical protein GQ600_25805 [Phytophthora cactorum]|nr:hypothetical protein GQ600_25805 [Phytophthora cactorum]
MIVCRYDVPSSRSILVPALITSCPSLSRATSTAQNFGFDEPCSSAVRPFGSTPALPAATEVPAEPPAAPLMPTDASAPVAEASLQAMLAENDNVDDPVLNPDCSPPSPASCFAPSSHRCGCLASFEHCCGFDDVLAAVQPLPDSLPDLPRRIVELEARLRSAEADAAAAKRSVVPQMLARESAEQLLKILSSKVESLEAENRRLRATNIRVDALLQKMKESTVFTRKTWNWRELRSLSEMPLSTHWRAFKAAVAANTEQTRQLHAILIKAQNGKFVDADTGIRSKTSISGTLIFSTSTVSSVVM